MPGRMALRTPREPGPRPFSSAWLDSPDPPPQPRRRAVLPDWIPESRALSAGLVVVLSLAVGMLALMSRTSPQTIEIQETPALVLASTDAAVAEPTTPAFDTAREDTQVAAMEIMDETGTAVDTVPESARAPDVASDNPNPVVAPPSEGPLLPSYRIVTFYGHPHDGNMGIVGEHSMEELAELLRTEAANYAVADPSRPVIPAFELIATVAQRVPGADGTYILDTDHQTLIDYIDYAEAQGMLVVLDVQIGRGTVANEIEKVRDLLMRPNVHLAIDPEFAVAEGETPGEHIGSVAAEDILYAQQVLSDISAANGLPPKMLIVHQFREDMIAGKERLAPYPGVQLVIDADGYGAPELKTAVYNFLVRDEPVEFGGVKLFYRQDIPVMSAQEILALVPPPDVVIYQ